MSYQGTWNLESIYPNGFDDDIRRLGEKSRELKVLSEGNADLKTLIDKRDECEEIAVSITAFADASLSVSSSDSNLMKAAERAERAVIEYSEAEDAFIRAVGRNTEAAPSGYEHFVDNVRDEVRHLMSKEEERLADELSLSGSSAWERLQETLSADIMESGKTLNELRSDAQSPSRDVRKNSFESELNLLRRHEASFVAALNGVKGTVLTLDGRRGWKTPLERSLAESEMNAETLAAMLAVIEESLPMFREYFRIKAKLLGIDDFSFFDLFAPLGKSRSFSFDEALDIVISSYDSFSGEMADFVREAADKRWIDSLMHKGKAGGAYDVYFPNVKESRIFLNFDSSYDSVLTLAHELGHGYHDRVVSSLPPSLSEYPMTLAETASVFAEKLVFTSLLGSCSGEEKIFIIDAFLQAASQVIVDIYSRFLFEKEIFDRRSSGPLSPEEFCQIMDDAEMRTYGDAISVRHPYMWAVKSHYYSADFSFYNYPYAFGEFFSLALLSRKDEEGFAGTYRNVLSLTGRATVQDVVSSAGFDVNSKDFFRIGIDYINENIKRLESWL